MMKYHAPSHDEVPPPHSEVLVPLLMMKSHIPPPHGEVPPLHGEVVPPHNGIYNVPNAGSFDTDPPP